MKKKNCLSALLLTSLVFPAASAANADDAATVQRVLEEKSSAIVTVKCVVKVKSGRNDQEMESENSGVMIDPKGLVLCSNTRLGGAFGLVRRMMGSSGSGVSITPTDIKIIVGDAADGVDAKFLARDTELDLAWIQIKEPSEKPYAYIDFNKSQPPRVGQQILSVYRTSKNYDRTPIIIENMVGGIVKKPREMYMAGDLSPALGLPAFSTDGQVVGVSILQIPDDDDESGQRTALNRMANSQEYSGALLPVAEVLKATTRAKESPASEPAAEDSSDDQSTTKPAAKAGKKPDDKKKADEEK